MQKLSKERAAASGQPNPSIIHKQLRQGSPILLCNRSSFVRVTACRRRQPAIVVNRELIDLAMQQEDVRNANIDAPYLITSPPVPQLRTKRSSSLPPSSSYWPSSTPPGEMLRPHTFWTIPARITALTALAEKDSSRFWSHKQCTNLFIISRNILKHLLKPTKSHHSATYREAGTEPRLARANRAAASWTCPPSTTTKR